jgi:hypothetical protein
MSNESVKSADCDKPEVAKKQKPVLTRDLPGPKDPRTIATEGSRHCSVSGVCPECGKEYERPGEVAHVCDCGWTDATAETESNNTNGGFVTP